MEKNLGHATAYGYAKSKGYSGTEDEFAELMADYASVGQSAAQSAEQAAASATSASGFAATASEAAQTATDKASEAVTAAGTSTTKASEASTSADTASAAATSASTSAQTATTAAATATAKASEASESAATATTAKTDAETARDAAARSASEADASASQAAESARTLTIDPTLAQSGQAADAKAAGDEIDSLKSALNNSLNGAVFFKTIEKKYINPKNGNIYTDAMYTATDFISTYGNDKILITSPISSPFGAWYNSEKQYISGLSISSGKIIISVPNNGAYFRTSFPSENISDFKVYSKVGKAAEKIETVKEINCLNGNDVNITEGKYINYVTGIVETVATHGATDKIPVVGGMTYVLDLMSSNYQDSSGLAFYENGDFISGVQYVRNQRTYVLNVPENANQIALSVTLADSSSGYFELQAINNIIDLTEFVKKISQGNDVTSEMPNVFAFNTVGIIGDSLASGCSNYKDSQDVWHVLGRKAFAWGKFLEKRQGCSVELFSQGGMDTRTWFTNANGYSKAQNNPCECYYIGLGVNDYSSLGANYLGSASDIHIGNEDTNADTFYGNYSKIIAKLTAIQPRCKIFCFTMPDSQSASQTRLNYDTAIRTVVALYDNAYLLDLAGDTFYTSEPIISTFYGAHYLATGYSMMADHILEITNKLMLENLDDFADIQWIVNNYPDPDGNS